MKDLIQWLKDQEDICDDRAEKSDLNKLYWLGKASAFHDIRLILKTDTLIFPFVETAVRPQVNTNT